MAQPVRRSRGGRRVALDLLAIERAAKNGTLSARDRKTVEAFFPGLLSEVLPEEQKGRLRDALGLNDPQAKTGDTE